MIKVKKAIPYSAIIIFLAALLFSFCKFIIYKTNDRYVMYFESLNNGKICTEVRFLPEKPVQGKEQLFVDELLLGPMTNRYRHLFTKGTRTEFCFVRNKTMFVGISKDALQISAETADIKKGMRLFKKNILKNFKNINTIEMFIDGKSV